MLIAYPGVSTAMQSTRAGCIANCCQWAFSAKLALANSGVSSIEASSQDRWERYGFEPSPCRELLNDPTAYQRCATRAFDRCRPSCRVPRTKQIRFYPGQVIEIAPKVKIEIDGSGPSARKTGTIEAAGGLREGWDRRASPSRPGLRSRADPRPTPSARSDVPLDNQVGLSYSAWAASEAARRSQNASMRL